MQPELPEDQPPLRDLLQEILVTKAYDRLSAFSDATSWAPLSQPDRELLAHLFVLAAESALKEQKVGDSYSNVKKSFDAACRLAPVSPRVWYSRGVVCASQEADQFLDEAVHCFERALSLDASLFEGWYAWANVLMRRAMVMSEESLLHEAVEKFGRAAAILEDPSRSLGQQEWGDFYWHYGLVCFMMARESGEAHDFHRAIGCYRKAYEEGLRQRDFFNDFGNALTEFAMLVNRSEIIFEAIELYLRSLELPADPDEKPHAQAVRHFNLGSCYHHLFDRYLVEHFFTQSREHYEAAITHEEHFAAAWRNLGSLFLRGAKLWQDSALLEMSVERLTHAAKMLPKNSLVNSRLAEACAHLGMHAENFELLQQAVELASSTLAADPTSAELSSSLAWALYERGRYFGDERTFLQAIEQATQGLAQNLRLGSLWHVLAVSKFSLGDIRDDLVLMEEAMLAFHWASKSELGRFGYFFNDWGVAFLYLADLTGEPKHVEEALKKFEQAIVVHENSHPEWICNYGLALHFFGDLTDDEASLRKSIQLFLHVLELMPQNYAIHGYLGMAFLHLGELSEDADYFERSIAHFHQLLERDAEDGQAWCELGMAYIYLVEKADEDRLVYFDRAEESLMRALHLGNSLAHYHLACLYTLQGNFPEAIHFLHRAYASDALPPIEDIVEDARLDALRTCAPFEQFLDLVRRDEDASPDEGESE